MDDDDIFDLGNLRDLFANPDEDWKARGLCAGSSQPDRWYPEKSGGMEAANRARAVCGFCPVTQQCLDYALERNEQQGIWGGLSIKERRKLRRETGQRATYPTRIPELRA